ncbi:hypothetical protein [Streptomyces sp. NPDC007940]|uniref:hypothetical protein n=1 Tax=Streptomyces sp. NPDC007940 TaxID=3364796 RepID=UPI0036E68E33
MTGPKAQYWRDIMRRDFPHFSGEEADFKCHLLDLLSREPSGVGKFVFSVALFAYGELDVLDDVLDNVPSAGHPARVLARIVGELIPAADGDVFVDLTTLRAWVQREREFLRWSEESGFYELQQRP